MIEEKQVAFPARRRKTNAERFKNADEAKAAFVRVYNGPMDALAIFRAFAAWLFEDARDGGGQ